MNISAAKTYIELLVLSRSMANGKKMYEFQKRCLDGIYICLRGDYIQDPETGKMMGSRPSEKVDKSGDSGIIEPSATGVNELKVKGFKNKQALNNHWKNGRTHQSEYVKDGITSAEQYEKRAVELFESPCSSTILGYKTDTGAVCRYDIIKNDYVKGNSSKGIFTMFKPIDGKSYFEEMKKKEGIIDE